MNVGYDSAPIYLAVVDAIEQDILAGRLPVGSLVPSTNVLAVEQSINPATVARAYRVLADRQVLIRRRGIGMAVAELAPALVLEGRRRRLLKTTLPWIKREARLLGLDLEEVVQNLE
jgi:DNA-binding transcriptional regulator YhcF (GntR family)